MSSNRISRVTTVSLSPSLYRVAERLAEYRGMTRSELFRDALRRYEMEEGEWDELLAYGRRKAAEKGVKSERDVERLIHETRAKKT